MFGYYRFKIQINYHKPMTWTYCRELYAVTSVCTAHCESSVFSARSTWTLLINKEFESLYKVVFWKLALQCRQMVLRTTHQPTSFFHLNTHKLIRKRRNHSYTCSFSMTSHVRCRHSSYSLQANFIVPYFVMLKARQSLDIKL